MISTSPSVAEIDATINVLSILEMAKDATSLKESLAKIKAAQDELAAQRELAAKDLEAVAGAQRMLDRQQAQLDADREALRQENELHIRNTADLANERAAMKEERNRFDDWMAKQREELERVKSLVAMQAAKNNADAAHVSAVSEELDERAKSIDEAKAAAEAARAEYEQKLAALKQMVF